MRGSGMGSCRLRENALPPSGPGLDVDLSNDGDYADIHTVCGVIKSFFRLLPEPLLPTVMYDDLIKAIRELQQRRSRVRRRSNVPTNLRTPRP